VAEDGAINQLVITHLLEALGCHVDVVANCFAVGMDDYASKPLVPEALQAILQRWVSPAQQG